MRKLGLLQETLVSLKYDNVSQLSALEVQRWASKTVEYKLRTLQYVYYLTVQPLLRNEYLI